jgi:hypothetical protein
MKQYISKYYSIQFVILQYCLVLIHVKREVEPDRLG